MAVMSGCAGSRPKMEPAQVVEILKAQKTLSAFVHEAPELTLVTWDGGVYRGTTPADGSAQKNGNSGPAPVRVEAVPAGKFGGKVKDPSSDARQYFVSPLERLFPEIQVRYRDETANDGVYRKLHGELGNEVVAEFRIAGWSVIRSTTFPDRYQFRVFGKGRFFRPADGQVLWEQDCFSETPDASDNPTMPELTANDGELAAGVLSSLAFRCGGGIGAAFADSARPKRWGMK